MNVTPVPSPGQPTIVGTGQLRFRVDQSWTTPADGPGGEIVGVACDSQDQVFLFARGAPHPVMVRDREGHELTIWGAGVFARPHGIFIGPEFGTVQRADLVEAARECGDAGFDVLIACAFNYEAHTTEFTKLGRIPVLKAHMNADLHMAGELKNTGKGNLFVIFGEPDIETIPEKDGRLRVEVNGVDVFHPNTGEVSL